MQDVVERRAIWIAAIVVVVMTFGSLGFGVLGLAELEAWNVALFVGQQAALVASLGLTVLVLWPGLAEPARTGRLLGGSLALLWLALLLAAINVSATAIEYIGEESF
jgi:hypothetical protein